jgi:hypothetical protein
MNIQSTMFSSMAARDFSWSSMILGAAAQRLNFASMTTSFNEN